MRKNGFTLLEVLAAMAIFSMIMVMMANIFHQSSIAWDSGTRKAQGAIQARVILANISRELQHAAALHGDALESGQIDIPSARSDIRFISFGDRETINYDGRYRDAFRITYRREGDSIVRDEELIASGSQYDISGVSFSPATTYVVATNVAGLTFVVPDNGTGSMEPHPDEGLPRWVTIQLQMGRVDDVSGVAAVSKGKDGLLDPVTDTSPDDVKAY